MRYQAASAVIGVGAILALSAAGLSAASAGPAGPAVLTVKVETSVNSVAGVPPLPPMPSGDRTAKESSEKGAPPSVENSHRKLSIILWSPLKAPADASATVTLPATTGIQEKIQLTILRDRAAGGRSRRTWTPSDNLTVIEYHGSSPTTASGQPTSTAWSKLTQEQQSALRSLLPRASQDAATGTGTFAVWPAGRTATMLPAGASISGALEVNSTYAGNARFEIPSGADFLAPLEMVSPDVSGRPEMDKAIPVRWKPAAGALAVRVDAVALKDKDTLVHWSAADSLAPKAYSADLSATDLAELIKKGALLPPDTTQATIPADIFKDCASVLLSISALGPGAVSTGEPTIRVRNVSNATAVLSQRNTPMSNALPDSATQ